MDLAIYTYGYGDAMFNVLNGVKMIINTPFFKAMIQMFAATSIVFAAAGYATSRGMNLASKPIIMKIASIYLVINLLITPRVTIWVTDRVTKTKQNVDDLPFAFVPIGWLEQVGDLMAGAIEQAFSPVANDGINELMTGKDFTYRDYGLAFGAQLMKEVRNWRIQNPEFALNMSNFIKRCVMYEALIGNKYTESSLYASPNAWELVKTKAGGFSRVVLNIDGNRENMTCYEAGQEIDKRYFASEIELLKRKYLKSTASEAASEGEKPIAKGLFGKLAGSDEGRANRTFMKNLEQIHGNFLESGSGVNIIKQQLMLNALKTFHASSSYGVVRAKMQQESTWATTGALAAEYLPIILTLDKCLMYAGLLFLLPMMVLGGGIARYQIYLLGVASLQLWPSLYSILNMFVEMYTSNSGFGADNGILSYTTYSTVARSADKIAAIAGSLQIFIPFISYQIVQGSVGGFIHLAGNLTAASQSAAAASANEVATGNRSLDNVSIGNMQMAMQSGFKTAFNQSYAAGSSSFQHTDGAVESVSASNTRAINSSHMKDQGVVSLNVHESAEQGLTQNLEKSQSFLTSTQVAKRDAEEAQISSATDWLTRATENRIAGKTTSNDQSSEEAKSTEKMTQVVEAISKEKGISTREASELVYNGGFSTGALKLLGINAGVDVSKRMVNEENISESQREAAEKQEMSKHLLNMTSKAAESESVSNQFGIDKSTSETVTATTHKVQEIAKTESQAKEDVARNSTALSNHKSNGGSMTTDSNHLVIEQLQKKYDLNAKQAHDWFHNPKTSDQRAARDQIASGLVQKEIARSGEASIQTKVQEFKNDYDKHNLNKEFESGQKAVSTKHNENSGAISKAGETLGFSKENVVDEVSKQEAYLEARNHEFQRQTNQEMDYDQSKLDKQYKDKRDNTSYKLPKDKEIIIMPGHAEKQITAKTVLGTLEDGEQQMADQIVKKKYKI